MRPRGRTALAAVLALLLAALAPLAHGGSASAKRAPSAGVKAKQPAAASARTSQRVRRNAVPRRRTWMRAWERAAEIRRAKGQRAGANTGEAAKTKVVEPSDAPTSPAAKGKHGSAGANGDDEPVQPDEHKHDPARKDAVGNPTPSPAGAGGGSTRPQLPRPAHSSSSSAGPSTPVPAVVQPTTAAGTVPARPLPVGAASRQPGSSPAILGRSAAGPSPASAAGEAAILGAPALRPAASLGSAAAAPRATREPAAAERRGGDEGGSPVAPVTRTVRDIVEVVPAAIRRLILALALLSAVLAGGYMFVAMRARRLARQRGELLQEVGLLQAALLPPVPSRLGAVDTSVAYRPSDGPAAGGDFYDALLLPGGRAAFILGDISGHGRAALARTAFVRYTLRAYLEAGLEPRTVLQVGGRVVDEHLGGDFATVVVAVHDPRTGSLTYASAGHPAPIVLAGSRHEPVLAASSPPIGLGMRTGVRQTTLPLPPGSRVCLYTDGLTEARTQSGILGRPRLADMLEELGPDVTAAELIAEVAKEARLVSDDMAAVVLSPTAGVTAGGFRTEQLEVDAAELDDGLVDRFLDACGADFLRIEAALREVRQLCEQYGGAVLHVRFGIRGPRIEVVPRNVESLEAASKRALALAR